MDQGALVTEQIDAGARFLSEFQKHFPVQSAFWLKESDEGERNLYVASDQINDDNFDVAYGEVMRIAGQLQDPWFDPFQVKVIGQDDPLAKAALDIQQRYPGRNPIRLNGKSFGGASVDDVYLYTSPAPAQVQ
ncbi:MAG: hypothetical protein ACJ8FY_17240 [Gemmataceae bacterium]